MSDRDGPTDDELAADAAELLEGMGPPITISDEVIDWVPPSERNGDDTARFRVLDAEGKPVSGAPVRVEIERADGQREVVQTTPGPTGYATTELGNADGTVERVSVEPVSGGSRTSFDPDTLAGDRASILRLGESREALDIPDAALEGLQDQVFTSPPGSEDVKSAPELFNPSVVEENGTCSIDFTAKVDVHENYFNQLVRMVPERGGGLAHRHRTSAEVGGEATEPLNGQIPFELTADYPNEEMPEEELPYLEYASEPTLGVMNVYEQSWTRVGHSLGKLLHSLTLAPCESTKVSIIEWSRTERGRREERSTAREQKQHELHRDRMINEIVEGMVKEDQWGSSSSTQGGIGLSGGIAGFVGSALGAAGMSIGGGAARSSSESHGRRELNASTIQNLSDSVVQSASNMRSLRSTVVTQSQQTERDEIRTRSVENHNRNHAMTVEYFQVLEHYTVETKLDRETEVLMIPYDIPMGLWEEMPSFGAFVLTQSERISILEALASGVSADLSRYLTETGETEIGDARAADEEQLTEDYVGGAVLSAGKSVIDEESDVHLLEDDAVRLAVEAWEELTNRISGTERWALPNVAIERGHFSRSDFVETVVEEASDAFDIADPRSESALIEWLDRNAESLRDIVPAEHDDAFDALYRLIHTPEVYETSKPTVTASNWTVELREAWRPGLTILIHSEGQTITLDRRSGTEGSAVASFSSTPVNVEAIDAIEVNFAPETATKTVIKSVTETVDDVGDAVEEGIELLTGQDDTPLTEEIEKAREFELDRIRVTAHSDPIDELPSSESYQLLDETDASETLTATNPAARWTAINQPDPDILETKTRRYEDYRAVEELANHVQANRMAYLRRLWLSEDPDKRALRFQKYAYPIRKDGEVVTRPLLDLIENEPLGVVGNSVAFRLLDQTQLDAYEPVANDDLSRSKVVSLPTKGVYAETLLSHCNATEIRDLDRVVDETNACGTEAPDIEGVTPGSRRSEVDTQPTGPPQSSVNIQQAPEAPAPTGLQGALKTLSQPNIFRDMSLGSETVNAANSLAKKALNESGQARKQTLEALSSMLEAADSERKDGEENGGNGGGGGSGSGTDSGGSGESAQQAAFDAARDHVQNAATKAHRRSDPVTNRDHQRNINKAHEEGAITEAERQQASRRLHNADGQSQSSRDVQPVTEMSVETGEQYVQGSVLLADFDIDEHQLKPEHKSFLQDQLMPNLGDEGRIPLLEGHASETGSEDHNLQLSKQRAQAVRDFLVKELGLPAHRIGDVTGVGENDPIDATGPVEDPAERSVVLEYESYHPAPVIRKREESGGSGAGKKYTNWRMRLLFEHDMTIPTGLDELAQQPLDQQTIGIELENTEESDPRTLKGVLAFRGRDLGFWLSTPQDNATPQTITFETEPMTEMAWNGSLGNILMAGASLPFTSGVHALVLKLLPMKNLTDVEFDARITPDDDMIGVQLQYSQLPAQLWLTDPAPDREG